MAEGSITLDPGSGGEDVATDEISSKAYQLVKLVSSTVGSTEKLSKAEDTAHTTGEEGIGALVVRADTAAALAGADGDYTFLISDANGRLHVLDANSAAIKTAVEAIQTAVELLDNTVSGSEMQVDIVSGNVTNAGTFVTQIDGDALTALQLIDDVAQTIDSAVGATDKGVGLIGKHKEDLVHLSTADGDYDILTLDSLGQLHVNAEGHHTFDDMEATTGWAVLGNDAANLATTTNHVIGTVALTFDKVDGAANTVIAGIDKTLTSVDLGDISPHDLIQGSFYIPDLSDVSYLFLRLGTDSTNYNEWRLQDTALTAATWLTGALTIGDTVGATGNGWDPSAITYIALGVVFDNQANTLSGIIFDAVSYHTNQHSSATLSAEISSEVSSPNVKLNGYGGNTPTGGGVESGALRVTLASDSTGVVSIDDNGASITVDGTVDLGATDNAVLDDIAQKLADIETAVQLIDNMISGSEAQVDVVAALPAGTNAIGKLAANSGVDIGDVDVTSIAAGSNHIGDVAIQGRATGGGSNYYDNDLDETAVAVKASAGTVYGIQVFNMTAAPLYLQLFNVAQGSVTVGTTTPTAQWVVPGNADSDGAGFTISMPQGIAFGTAITAAASTDNEGNGAPAANACHINLQYV